MSNPTKPATVSPSDFPLCSPKSRAVARALLRLRRPAAYVVEADDSGQPIYEADRRYGEAVLLAPRKLTAEDWIKRYAAKQKPGSDKE